MRTTLNLDGKALKAAMKYARGMTKTAVINEALREYARRHAMTSLLELAGKVEGDWDLDELRGRVPPAKKRRRSP